MTRGGALRIILIGDTYLPERAAGAVRASELAQRWRERGQEVTVVTGNPHYPEGHIFPGYRNGLYARDAVNGIPVHRLFTIPYARNAVAKRILNQVLFGFLPVLLDRAGPADVVVASSPPPTIGVAGWLMARRRGVPFVFDVRDLYPAAAVAYGVLRPGPIVGLFDFLANFIYTQAARVVTASQYWSGMLRAQGIASEKVSVIPNGANTDRFAPGPRDPAIRKQYGIPGECFLVGYVGLLGRAHGADVIVDAAERLRDAPGIHLLLVGEGADKARMQERAAVAGLTNITFAPSVPADAVPALLNACDAGLATLRGVHFTKGAIPVKIFETMACGLPVVLAGWGDTEEIVRAAGAGIIVPCGDGARIAEAVRALAADKEAARSMGRAGRSYVVASYDRRKLADEYLGLLAQTVETFKGGPSGSGASAG